MNELKVFGSEKFGDLEVLEINGQVHFPAADVANKLGYSNPHDAVRRHTKEKGCVKHEVLSNGGVQLKNFINESNLYRLIVNSRLPEAEQFEEWVFEDVLPQIRKTGSYETPKDPMEIMRLQFEALDQTNKEVKTIKEDVTYLKDEVKLDAGEYDYLTRQVNRSVGEVVRFYSYANTNEVRSQLYKDINSGVNEICGVRTRTQLRQKHFDQAMEYINAWVPSTATKMKVQQLTLDLEEEK